MAEAVKVAFADRDAWVTDPDAIDVAIKTLLSESYLAERRDLIDPGSSLPADVKADLSPEDHSVNSHNPGGDTCYLVRRPRRLGRVSHSIDLLRLRKRNDCRRNRNRTAERWFGLLIESRPHQ